MKRLAAFFSLMVMLIFGLTGCTTSSTAVRKTSGTVAVSDHLARLVAALPAGASVAVSVIHDRETGDVTALSEGWREQLEGELARRGVTIKARHDLAALVREAQTFRGDLEEYDIWNRAGADVLVNGTYCFDRSAKDRPVAELTVKALALDSSEVLATVSWTEPLPSDWPRLRAQVRGNVYQRDVAAVAPESQGPQLTARLDRNPPCYRSGSKARLMISTEAGVYLYIFNIAADNSVTILYPNRLQGNQPLASGRVTFPDPSLGAKISLQLYSLAEGGTNRESFKVVASRHPLDFSFLPVPENRIFTGAEGGRLKQVLGVLRQAREWSQQTVPYLVGQGCE